MTCQETHRKLYFWHSYNHFGQCSPDAIGTVIYSLMNEGGKQRANQKGDARKRKEWRTFIMSNGERSAATIMATAKVKIKAGQEVRLVNIPVKRRYGAWDDLHGLTGDGAGAALSDAIRKAAESNYGHAGRAFLKKLVDDKRDWSDAWAQYRATEELGAQSGDGQDQRVAARFALIALAGEVATEYDVLPWPAGTAASAAATILRESYGERVAGNNEPQQIIDHVLAFIDREESRFEPDYNPPDLAIKARAGWTDKNGIFEFTGGGLREATEGFDFHRVLDVLVERGALPIQRDGKRSKMKKVNRRPTRVYPVDSTKLQPLV